MFTPQSFSFLKSLELNNNKNWFEENRQTYQNHIIDPIKKLIDDLDLFVISDIDDNLETKPVINKAISRIYRDVRFSNNKKPFKSYIGFNFRRKSSDWKYYPSFFFRIFPDGYIFGLGVMKNNPDHFANFREKIDFNVNSFEEIIKPVFDIKDGSNGNNGNNNKNSFFEILGENYKKYQFKIDKKQKNYKQISDKSLINIEKLYCKKNIFIKFSRDKEFYNNQQELVIDIEKKFRNLIGLYKFIKNSF